MRESYQIFVMAVFVFLTFAGGYIDTSDADASIETARSLVTRGSFRAQPKVPDYNYYSPTAACCYTKMGWLHPILYAPTIWLIGLFQLNEMTRWRAESFLISLINPLLSALMVVVLFLFFRRKQTFRTSLVLSLFSIFATLILPYSKTAHREPAQALLLTLAFYLGSDDKMFYSLRRQLSLALTIFAAVACKLALIAPLIPLGVYLAWRSLKQPKPWLLGLLLASGLSALAIISRVVFGSFLSGGYADWVIHFDPGIWSTPFLKGIAEQIGSINSGFIVYQPWSILIPAIILMKWKRRTLSALDGALCASFILQVCLYAKWYSPIGVEAIGPRYLVAVTPLVVMLLQGVQYGDFPKMARAFACLTIFSVAIQLINSSVKIQQYWSFQWRAEAQLPEPHWLVNLKFFKNKLLGNKEVYAVSDFGIAGDKIVSLEDATSLQGFNFWWLHLARSSGLFHRRENSRQLAERN